MCGASWQATVADEEGSDMLITITSLAGLPANSVANEQEVKRSLVCSREHGAENAISMELVHWCTFCTSEMVAVWVGLG